MICPSCGTANPSGTRFCGSCGTSLSPGCSVCGFANPPGNRFCGNCGTAIGANSPAAKVASAEIGSPGPVAERRLVSVLFADLVGFTPFAEEKDAEDVRDTLTRYFSIATRIVERYGGTIEKFIGDAVMAVWGAPTAREDDAERAVRAALDLVDAVAELGSGIAARGGVMTGEAAVTIGRVNEGMVAGDLVNTAARVQSVAPPGGVLVGEATMRAAGAAISFEPSGDQLLKGKSSPVATWRAMQIVAQRGGLGRSDLPEPPFVGREHELRVLKDLVGAGEPAAQLVSITGPGGIGKSRLAWELLKYIDGISGDIYWHRGRSPSYGDGIAFWALGEMIRRRAGLAEDDTAEATRDRIHATVAEFVPDDEDRRWVEPALLTLLGVEPPPVGGRDVLFAGWRIFFERIAEHGRTILLFEDLQWADAGLLDFIEHLLEWSRKVPILVVTLARPELSDHRPDWGAGTRHLTRIALEPLDERAMRQLLTGFVSGLSDPAVDAIVGRADGMPLYAVELVRSLVADGRIALVDGVYRLTGELGPLSVPDTLRSLIASRLDTLEASDRSLVADAAVLGQVFTIEGLAAVSGLDPTALEPRLRSLVRNQLFDVEMDPGSPERGQHRFVQGLIREVAYATLARRDRRERHLAAARYYESLGDDELAGALASHFVSAHAASSPGAEADALAVQARLALSAAADRAVTLGAHDQAVLHLRAAIVLAATPEERGDLLLRAGSSASAAARHALAEELAREAVSVAQSTANGEALGRATSLLGEVLIDTGQAEGAATTLEEAIASLAPTVSDVTRADLHRTLSHALMRTGAAERCLEAADEALRVAEPLGLELIIAEALNNKASALGYLGRQRESLALMRGAVEVARSGGYVAAEIRALFNLSATVQDMRDARATCTEAIDLAMRVGNRSLATWASETNRLNAHVLGEGWDEALAIDVTRDAGPDRDGLSEIDRIRSLFSTGLLLGARGESTDALIDRMTPLAASVADPVGPSSLHLLTAERALLAGAYGIAFDEGMAAAGWADMAPFFMALIVRAAVWSGDADRARRARAFCDAVRSSDAFAVAARHAAAGAVAALEGRDDEAIAEFVGAIGEYRAVHGDFFAALTSLDLLIAVGPDHAVAREAAADARVILERVGAVPYLRRLDEAMEPARRQDRAAIAAVPSELDPVG